jgi:hypothetical protein
MESRWNDMKRYEMSPITGTVLNSSKDFLTVSMPLIGLLPVGTTVTLEIDGEIETYTVVAEEETDPCIHCDLPATDGGECCDDHKGVDDADEVRLSRGW